MCDNDYQLVTHTFLGIIHKAKQRPKSVGKKKEQTQKVCENKETDSPSGINRMKLAGTCSLLKESHEKIKKNKKMGLLFLGSGTPTFWLGLLLFIKRESRTPTFKILVRTLAKKNVFRLTLEKKIGWIGRDFFFFFLQCL